MIISSHRLADLREHHIIIYTGNVLYKVPQSAIPKIGREVSREEEVVALQILQRVPGGIIRVGRSRYFALNCSAFRPPEPEEYEFKQSEMIRLKERPTEPNHDFVIILPEGRSYLIEAADLHGYEWSSSEKEKEVFKEARSYVMHAIRSGLAIGLFPKAKIKDARGKTTEVVFCYCINCEVFSPEW